MVRTSYANETKLQLLHRIDSLERTIDELTYERNVLETQEPDAPELAPSEVVCNFWEQARSYYKLDLCREIVKGLGKRDTQALINDLLSVI